MINNVGRRTFLVGSAALLAPAQLSSKPAILHINTPMVPPPWAIQQRRLFKVNADACEAFYQKYVDQRHRLKVFERWGANDGPDDAAEATNDWFILHALGGSNRISELAQLFWEGHLKQFAALRTQEVKAAREGMYFREFPVQMDWQHNAEGLTSFNVMGLSIPRSRKLLERNVRYTGFYNGTDPTAPNYDIQKRMMRSLMNGSRGPMLRDAAPLDWAGDRFEAGARFHMEHGERTYEETLEHYAEYGMVVGDNPLNLQSTTLGLNAFALGGGEKHRRWALDYLNAWLERAQKNGDILPSYVRPDGTVGNDWWKGVYGWGFSPVVPQTGEREHRNRVPRSITAFMNGVLLSKSQDFIDMWRKQNARINDAAKYLNGVLSTPTMFGENGWYGWKPGAYKTNGFEIWYVSQRNDDRALAGSHPWLDFLEGRNPDYPDQALSSDFDRIAERVKRRETDDTTPDTRLADWPININPASVKSLVQLMTGGLHIARPPWSPTSPSQGGVVLHCRLRYFDPVERRSGVPTDVAALVHQLGDTSTEVTLVNTGNRPRTVTVQGGAYAEHRLETVKINGVVHSVRNRDFTLTIEPGCGARLKIAMARYANSPTLAFPWDRK